MPTQRTTHGLASVDRGAIQPTGYLHIREPRKLRCSAFWIPHAPDTESPPPKRGMEPNVLWRIERTGCLRQFGLILVLRLSFQEALWT